MITFYTAYSKLNIKVSAGRTLKTEVHNGVYRLNGNSTNGYNY